MGHFVLSPRDDDDDDDLVLYVSFSIIYSYPDKDMVDVLKFRTPKLPYAKSADPDQTLLKVQSDQGLHHLPFH